MRRSLCLLLATAAMLLAQKRPFDIDALLELKRLSDPQISPDGRWVAFTVQSVDVAANKKPMQIWIVPLAGGAPRQITHDGAANQRPRWSPDSKRIAYISDRSGSSQIWLMDPDGANSRQVTSLATEADGVLYSPDGKNLVFTSSVFPECGADDACNKRLLDAESATKARAHIYTELLYRHWTTWSSQRRSHLLVVPTEGRAVARDLTPGNRDVPPFSLGGPDDYDISPDGKEVCYSMNADAVPAISTNADLYVVAMAGGDARKITSTPGADSSPKYSPDGKYLAWRAQTRPGYEADRWRLMVLERSLGRVGNLTEGLDRWVNSFTWTPDSANLFFTVGDRGRQNIQLISVNGGAARVVAGGDSELDDMQLARDGKTMVYTQQSGVSPIEIFRVSSSGGEPSALTHLNDATLASRQMTPLEEFFVAAPDGARVHSFLVKPFGFQPDRKYPVVMLIHGGPQGFWGHAWTYRWNAQMFAAAGYVVVMPNPRGSTGYGQKFIDEINNDWGGRAFDDIMAVADHVVANLPYADGSKLTAAGASYGGYMIDWILGHTQRFKALVTHDGVYDLVSEFGATEELWFPLWEFGGTPWDKPEDYAKWSPSRYVKDFKTPTLVIHGEQDFRVPYTQGLQFFTALQMQKVPSKLLLFPDEGHWVLKPQNSALWYKTVIDWLDSWGKKVKVILILVVLIVVVFVGLFASSGHSAVAFAPAVTIIGVSTPVTVRVENPHGARSVRAYIEQNGAQSPLLDVTEKSTRFLWKRHEPPKSFTFDAGKTKAPNLKEGKARIVVEAVSNDLRGSSDSASAEVNVVLTAPRVIPDDAQHYINQGGMELVTFNATGSYNESGVKVGKYTFRSFPLPGKGPEQRFAMFAYSWELPPDLAPLVYARNQAGTEATAHFWFKLFPKKFRTRDVDADDKLLDKLVTSVDPTGQLAPGSDLVARFDKINTELRARNNQQLADLRFKTEEKILWDGPFTHWGKEEADFADVRNWMHAGKKIDQAVHLGFDLSDVQNGPVNAANDGRVVHAADLGIYGNCVVLDHGYALQSIYGHMRQINVKVGDLVKKGQSMGIAGQTGLAGGVHVHFSMQIDGVQVNPREWWDEHWIRDRILSKLAPEKITPEMAAKPAPVSHKKKKR